MTTRRACIDLSDWPDEPLDTDDLARVLAGLRKLSSKQPLIWEGNDGEGIPPEARLDPSSFRSVQNTPQPQAEAVDP